MSPGIKDFCIGKGVYCNVYGNFYPCLTTTGFSEGIIMDIEGDICTVKFSGIQK